MKNKSIFVHGMVFGGLVGLFILMINGFTSFQKNNPIQATVIANSGSVLNKIQHKNNASLETEVWVRIRFEHTNVVDELCYNSPFAATDYPVGSKLIWNSPSRLLYERSNYSLPWFFSEASLMIVLILILIHLSMVCVICITSHEE